MSPGVPGDGSYFPYSDANGTGDVNPHPFRYSREQILAHWDEDKVKGTPIELVEILEAGGVLVSKDVIRPVGLRDLTEAEKRVRAFDQAFAATG